MVVSILAYFEQSGRLKSRIERGQNGNIRILDVLEEELEKNFPLTLRLVGTSVTTRLK